MSNNFAAPGSPWGSFSGPNLGYVMEQYDLYRENPEQVDPELAELFRNFGPPAAPAPAGSTGEAAASGSPADLFKAIAAVQLADAIRDYGHLAADIFPLKDYERDSSRIEPSAYGLDDADLHVLPASLFFKDVPAGVTNGLEAIRHLRKVYTGKAAYEFAQVIDPEERDWLQSYIESGSVKVELSKDEKKALLERLTKVEGFEKFIHRTFVGAKRFSIEGLDTLVVLLDELVRKTGVRSMKELLIGMAHRGRLNVLTHVLNKPYEIMFAQFAGLSEEPFMPKDGSLELTRGWFGDVKYHMGATYNSPEGLKVKLAYNPSHLEVVNPVITGQTRAAQDETDSPGQPVQHADRAHAVLIHGDAAFTGEGINPETFNYSRTNGFNTGGSIHVIANNMIGFTTEHYDSRSTLYSSDPAKGYEVPVIHVNADAPEMVIAVARLAFEYRERFGKDILIDLLGYRRFGHNEMDEPLVTNPMMYHHIHQHPTVRELYGKQLAEEGILTEDDVKKLDEETFKTMQAAYDRVKETSGKDTPDNSTPEVIMAGYPGIDTGVSEERLRRMNAELLEWPGDFHVFKKLSRILKRREEPFNGKGKIDWAHAETLAFGSILQDGHPVRLTGQDAQRGTFAQRHLVLHDEQDGTEYVPLHHISDSKASFAVYNSPLSEASIVAYEFGYSLENQNALVLWEAQYGDFANMAQMMFDQFISSSASKWGQNAGMVMLLPHGYEGQGPEHSSARIERYLQLSAENNWTVANLSSAANYFHILRRQAEHLGEETSRPLVITTPKSLLRHPLVGADLEDLTDGKFQTVIEQPGLGKKPKKVERIAFASGKMAIDLAEQVKEGEEPDWLHIVRVEQLYPFPSDRIREIVARFPNVKEFMWVQEEPKNMGSWSFAEPYIREIADGKDVVYNGRIMRSSPSEGDGKSHKIEQDRIIQTAMSK
ncbi:2-oxoglutarate dehydrogenase E1 component [Edaphobacillus lindanitolerans]|uniref:2-oxoglutarate dehydrogenase E1 component n=1 Tax=Edaphobacillus lindanitolerans TaxID=550447 RepID=A0A1U7PMD6_9BACI|nr:2-oxoglutarate dehydrogenase E1 component [Edaphobacillus lindanitolerans]SIT80740.1 2-oxoglutarate dehydrogenase E1 component [Edaphobacillus lindanitolerans]